MTILQGENRFDKALVALDGGANPPSSKFLAESGNAAVYCFTGYMCPLTGNRIKASPAKSFCQSVPKTSMKVGEPWATIGQAATHAGRWTDIPEQSLLLPSGQCRLSGGSGATLRAESLRKPAIEKEARLRPQHFIFGGEVGPNNQGSLWRN